VLMNVLMLVCVRAAVARVVSDVCSKLSLLPTFSLETLDLVQRVVRMFEHVCSHRREPRRNSSGHLLLV